MTKSLQLPRPNGLDPATWSTTFTYSSVGSPFGNDVTYTPYASPPGSVPSATLVSSPAYATVTLDSPDKPQSSTVSRESWFPENVDELNVREVHLIFVAP